MIVWLLWDVTQFITTMLLLKYTAFDMIPFYHLENDTYMTSTTFSKTQMYLYLVSLGITAEYSYGVASEDGSNITIRMQMNSAFLPGDSFHETIGIDGKPYNVHIEYFKIS